jgi:hypothetical protein
MSNQEGARRRDMSMYDALLDDRIERHGGLDGYAARIDVSPSTLWRWRARDVNPFHYRRPGRERFQRDVGLNDEQLSKLSEVSVVEACEIVLNHIDAAPPEDQAPQPPSEPSPAQLPPQLIPQDL